MAGTDLIKRTVFVECDLRTVSSDALFRALKLENGPGAVSSVVPSKDGFIVSFHNAGGASAITDAGSLEVEGKCVAVYGVDNKTIIVTLYDLPELVLDKSIEDKLIEYGCTLVSPIKWRKHEDVYFGQRTIKIKLPEGVTSLPKFIKLRDVLGRDTYYKVQHESQGRVCNGCLSNSHVYKDCPKFICFRCKEQGHISRECPNRLTPSVRPGNNESVVKVKVNEIDLDTDDDDDDDDIVDIKEGEGATQTVINPDAAVSLPNNAVWQTVSRSKPKKMRSGSSKHFRSSSSSDRALLKKKRLSAPSRSASILPSTVGGSELPDPMILGSLDTLPPVDTTNAAPPNDP